LINITDSVPKNPYPVNVTLEEIMNAIEPYGRFFKRMEDDRCITIDYDNTHFPMMQFKKVFRDPQLESDEKIKRELQVIR
jgi:hypothetical protein